MKKVFIIIAVVIIIGCMSFAMVACGFNNEFSKLERAFASTSETVASLDEAASQDVSDDSISLSVSQSPTPIFLATNNVVFALAEDDSPSLSSGEKAVEILNMRQSIREKQTEINDYKESLEIEVAQIKSYIKDFRAQGLSLTEDEKVLIVNYIDEIISMRDDIKSTIGKVYREMKGLRGKYNLQNIDLVYDTTYSVEEQIIIRKEALERLNEIALELNDYLENRLNPDIEEGDK